MHLKLKKTHIACLYEKDQQDHTVSEKMPPLRRLMEIVRAWVLRTYVGIILLRSAPKHLKFLPHAKNIMILMWNCFCQILRCGKKIWDSEVSKQWDWAQKLNFLLVKNLSSSTTQRIHQKSNPSSFSNRKRPLHPSCKNNHDLLPTNLGFFGTISSTKSPLRASRSLRG